MNTIIETPRRYYGKGKEFKTKEEAIRQAMIDTKEELDKLKDPKNGRMLAGKIFIHSEKDVVWVKIPVKPNSNS